MVLLAKSHVVQSIPLCSYIIMIHPIVCYGLPSILWQLILSQFMFTNDASILCSVPSMPPHSVVSHRVRLLLPLIHLLYRGLALRHRAYTSPLRLDVEKAEQAAEKAWNLSRGKQWTGRTSRPRGYAISTFSRARWPWKSTSAYFVSTMFFTMF